MRHRRFGNGGFQTRFPSPGVRVAKYVRLPARLLTALNAKIGDALETEIRNGELLIRPVKRYRLSDLLAETEAAPPRAEGWEEMPDVGQEGV
ncbi:TPA: AbrB/MazE/SpoVT family DNA-binding domain-containing protein [Neisseria gonorrhoeae]